MRSIDTRQRDGGDAEITRRRTMLITHLIDSLSDRAVITPLTPTSVIIYDKNELKVYVGFTNNRNSLEYTKEVVLLLSTEIPKKAEIREIIVSKNGDYVILEGPRSLFVVRIGAEILVAKPDRLPSECFCECYPLHDSLLLQNISLSVVKVRLLPEKCDEKTFVTAVLFSDNYSTISRKISFDLIPPKPNTSHFSIISIDSDCDFYTSFVHFSCFKEGYAPRIHRIEPVDGLPCDPLDLRYIQTTNPRICSVFVLVSGGGVLSHLVVFPNEFGEFRFLVKDQLRLPSSNGDPRIVQNQIRSLKVSRYEIATSSSLFSVNIFPWFEALTSISPTSTLEKETRVSELVDAVIPSDELSNTTKWTGARALRAVSVQLTQSLATEEEELLPESENIMHLVILENKDGQPAHLFNISTFDNIWSTENKTSFGRDSVSQPPMKSTGSLEQQLAALKPLAACVISEKVSCEEAIDAAMKFFDAVDERLKKHCEISKLFVERCLAVSSSAQALDEKQQSVDQRLIEETNTVEELKIRMHETKERMEGARKGINVLFHRVDENVPLSDNEIRIFERLKEHQKMLSDMTKLVPKMTLDSNEIHRMANIVLKKRGTGEEQNRFAAVEKNATEIESLEARENKLNTGISELSI
nr:hypothetical protein ZK177.4 - Caenorhabditis elegans [Caenorhabditis elegans]